MAGEARFGNSIRHSYRQSIIDYEILQGGRKLGKLERFHARCHSHVDGLNMISQVMFLASSESINEEIFAETLIHLAQKYEVLRMRIIEIEGKLHLKPMQSFTPKLQILPTSNWVHQMESELLNPMDLEKGPLWRVVYLPNVDSGRTTKKQPHEHCLIFSYSHAIADSISCIIFLSAFLEILDCSLANKTQGNDKVEIMQPIDFFVDKLYNPSKRSRLKRELCYWYLRTGLPLPLPCRQSTSHTELLGKTDDTSIIVVPQTRIIPLEFTKDTIDKLQMKCVEKGTNMQGLFQAVGSVALAKLWSQKTQDENITLEVSAAIPVNLRCFIPLEGKKCLGNFTSCVDIKWNATAATEGDEIWDLAVESSLLTLNALGRRNFKRYLQMYSYISTFMRRETLRGKDPSGVMRRPASKGRAATVSFETVDNVTDTPLERGCDARVTVTGLYHAVSQHSHGPVFANHLVTIGGVCHMTVCWYSNVTTPEEAQFYASSIRSIVNELVR